MSKFPRKPIKVLKNWVLTHEERPYATDVDLTDLRQKTGLTKIQLRNWLTNEPCQQKKVNSPKAQLLSHHTPSKTLGKGVSDDAYPYPRVSLVCSDANSSCTSPKDFSRPRNSPSVLDLVGRRRKRRRGKNNSKAVQSSIAVSPRPFQCTFCVKALLSESSCIDKPPTGSWTCRLGCLGAEVSDL